MHRILLVDDAADSYALASRSLDEHSLAWAKNLDEAARAIERESFDLILLDVELPDGESYQFCSLLQFDARFAHLSIMFLTARTAVTDKVLGFTVGADDFLTKPYYAPELKARVNACIRRKKRHRAEAATFVAGEIEIDKRLQVVRVTINGLAQKVDLSQSEFKLLSFLSGSPGKAFTRDQLIDNLWGADKFIGPRAVDTVISKLRVKLGRCCEYIATVHGIGYRFGIPETYLHRDTQKHLMLRALVSGERLSSYH